MMQTNYYPQPNPFLPVTLYVGDLDEIVHEEQLFAHFSKYGRVHSAKVVRDRVTKKSRGFAYVNYFQYKDAESARLLSQYEVIGRKPIRVLHKVNPHQNTDANLFVKNLDLNVNSKDLHNHFNGIGSVISVKIMRTSDGKSLGYGYVQFETTQAAEEAIIKLNGMKLKEQEIIIEKFQPRARRTMATLNNIYVRHLPEGKSKEEIEKALEELFTPYGKITSLLVMRKEGMPWAAFVCFEKSESAIKAKNALDGQYQLEGAEVPLYVNIHRTRSERSLERKRAEQKPNETNIFIKNLKPEVSEGQVRDLFKIFGEITNCGFKEIEYQGNKYKMFFINYKCSEEAIKAQSQSANMEEIRKLFYDGKPFVRLWMSKEQRDQFKRTKANRQTSVYPPAPGTQQYQAFPQPYPNYGPFVPVQAFEMIHPAQFPQSSWPRPRSFVYNGHLSAPQRPQYQTQVRSQQGPSQQRFDGGNQFSRSRQGPFANPRPSQYQRPLQQQRPVGRNVLHQRGFENRDSRFSAEMPQDQPSQEIMPAVAHTNPAAMSQVPLTVQHLKDRLDDFRSMSTEKQRNILGEMLFPKILEAAGSELAPKITGMLVDFDVLTVQDIIESLEDQTLFNERIQEAQELIRQEGEAN